MEATVSVTDPKRGAVQPRMLRFSPSNWNVSQEVTLYTASYAYLTLESRPFFVQLALQSGDRRFDGMRPRVQVSFTLPPSSRC